MAMKILKTFLFVAIICSSASGQFKFQKTFLGSCNTYGNFIQQCSDSGYVIASSTCFGIYVVRTNPFGDTTWTNMYNDTTGNYTIPYARCIRQTSDNGFLITGALDEDGYYLKINSTGNKQWSHHSGGEQTYFFNILQPDSGGYIISAYTDGPTLSNAAYFFGVDSNGSETSSTFIASGGGGLMTFKQTLDGGIITVAINQNSNIYSLVKYGGTTGGWSKVIFYQPVVIVPMPDSGYAVATTSSLIRLNSSGDSLWSTSLGLGLITDFVNVDSAGNVGYAFLKNTPGFYSSFEDDQDNNLVMTRTDSSGNTIWSKTYGGFGLDLPSNLIRTNDGGFAIVGTSRSIAEHAAIIFIKTDAVGNIQ